MDKVRVTADNVEQFLCARIFGGLGNQMFQYAAAWAQSKRSKAQLLLHVVGSERLDHASFGLSQFAIDAGIWDEASGVEPSLLKKTLQRKMSKKKHGGHWPGQRYAHDGLTYDPIIQTVTTGSYLAGYFQSEAYFSDYADEIRQQFSFAHLDAQIDKESRRTVGAAGTVSVHIRRGDYLYDPKVLKTHGIMEDDYYLSARDLMIALEPNCTFCIFSDDLDAADALTQGWPNRVLMPPTDRMHDLALMSKCDHHIVANSSFSWWGAWLNASLHKHVIAPRRWYTREHMQKTYIDDICPKGWILI